MKIPDYYESIHWLDCKISEIVEVTECDPDDAERIAKELLDTNRIPFGYTLYFEKFGYVTVAEVLSNGDKFDQHFLCDPYRYNHGLGRNEAVFNWRHGNPMIHSTVDGGTVYETSNEYVGYEGY